jgi:hypothetical protein
MDENETSYPLETVVYGDEASGTVFWLEGDVMVTAPMMVDGMFYTDDAADPDYGLIASDLAAHDLRVHAALLRSAGLGDLAEQKLAEAVEYEREAASETSEFREFPDGLPTVDPGLVVRLTLKAGVNPIPGR